jgi:hypothetical protein
MTHTDCPYCPGHCEGDGTHAYDTCRTCTAYLDGIADAAGVSPGLSVVAVAIEWNGLVFSAPKPARHDDLLRLMAECGADKVTARASVPGFMTSDGHFLGRRQAKIVARNAGQLLERASGLDELFSEDVW